MGSEDDTPRGDTDRNVSRSLFDWRGVEEQVAAGLILMATCGIGFIAFTVPQRLDLILEKMTAMTQRISVLENRVDQVEGSVEDLKLKTRHTWK
jgi:hypothetical protein